MSNETVVTAEPGKQELFITREFDAPAILSSELIPTLSSIRSGSVPTE